MKYLKVNDIATLVKQNVLNEIVEENYNILDQLETLAVSEIDANIGFKFDTKAALEAENPFLKMTLIDIVLYHLYSRMTHLAMQEIRTERYNKATQWLIDTATGKIVPNLPMNAEPLEFKSKNIYSNNPNITEMY